MQNPQAFLRIHLKRKSRNGFLLSVFLALIPAAIFAQIDKQDPSPKSSTLESIVVNGDKVEFSTEKKEVIATGNVEVFYKGAKLTCDRLIVNSQTKDGEAQGNARLEDASGIIVGSKIMYNFATKTGVIIDSGFRSNPYFGRAKESEKVSEDELVNRRGYLTTCDYDDPHWRIKSRKMTIFPGDKIQTKDDTFYAGKIPLLYMPQFNRSLRDPIMHVQMMPGKSKEWGPYMLTAWRYNLTEDVTGRIYLDYRSSLGVAEGFGVNYTSAEFGKGNFKYYYTQERNKTKALQKNNKLERPDDTPKVFQRYLIRWRHKWDIDPQTNLVSEYWKIADSKMTLYPGHNPSFNFLKEYFFKEYETDAEPLSYVSVHRSLSYFSVDFLMQKRTNRWYGETEKLPEIRFSLPSYQIGESRFYFDHSSLAGNYNQKTAAPSDYSNHSNMLDMNNKLSVSRKIAFVEFTPFVKHQGTYYQSGVDGTSNLFRTIFYTGTDASTKFYRTFNVKSNFLHLDINGLRHIITPTISYSYNNMPTVSASKIIHIDGVDSFPGRSNSASLGVSNVLQTKRNNSTVDILNFLVTAPYTFKTKGNRGSTLGDFLLKLDLIPYSWVSAVANATYSHSRNRLDPNYGTFSSVNYDINFNLGAERSFGFGERYQRKGPNEFTFDFKWRLTPKWKFSIYQRYVEGDRDLAFKRGLREQEYVVSRDLHCWTMDITYNVTRDRGESIWLLFTLKAFPELQFNYNQEYHKPKPGELSY